MIDILISFRTVYYDDDLGMEEVRPMYIAKNYIKDQFIIDLLSTVPFDSIVQLFTSTDTSNS